MNFVRYLIVGIDPGNTVGIAVLGLDGRKISLQSTSAGIDEAIGAVEKLGTPSIVATDVYPAPENVLRVASSFNAKLFVPRGNVREDMKREIAKDANVSNAHERDAYCAAVLAYRAHANKLRQISALPDFSVEEKEKLMHLTINGYTLKNAILSLSAQKEGKNEEQGERARTVPAQEGHNSDSKFSQLGNLTVAAFGELRSPQKLQYEVASLSRENAHLKKLVQTLENEKQALAMQVKRLANGAYAKMMQEREVRNLKYQVKVLGEIIQRMRGGKRKSPDKKGEKAHLQHPQSKGIKKLQEKEEQEREERQETDIEALINEYRQKRQ
ncbi:Uncharacterised protein [Candidatus Anstonella stagnisolia]|nr:Uncharacterised protein [Candidatus Anstonella stagnisolia]